MGKVTMTLKDSREECIYISGVETGRKQERQVVIKEIMEMLPKLQETIPTYGDHDDFVNAQIHISNGMIRNVLKILKKVGKK